LEQKTTTSILSLTKAGSLLLLFIVALHTPVALAAEYYVTPSQSDGVGMSATGERGQEVELIEIPYWRFVLLIGVAQISSSPEFILTFKYLRFAPVLGGVRRINRSNVLNNSSRDTIFNIIRSVPGIHLNRISKDTGINLGTLRHHIDILENEKVIMAQRINGKVRFFMNGSAYSDKEKTLISLLKNDIDRKIIYEILKGHPINNNSLAEKLGVCASTVSWHLKHIREKEIIEMNKDGKNNNYNICPDYYHLIEDASDNWLEV